MRMKTRIPNSSMSKAAFGKGAANASLAFLRLSHEAICDRIRSDIWLYATDSFEISDKKEQIKAAMFQLSKEFVFDGVNIITGGQFFNLSAHNDGYTITGVQLAFNFIDNYFEFDFDMVGGDKRVIHFWGGVPEFTAMEEFDLGAFSINAKATKAAKLLYKHELAEGTSFILARAYYEGEDKIDYSVKNASITDSMMTFSKGDFEYSMLYENFIIHKTTGSNKGSSDHSVVRIAMQYSF